MTPNMTVQTVFFFFLEWNIVQIKNDDETVSKAGLLLLDV